MNLEKFKIVVIPLRDKLLATAIKILSDSADADDAVQEAFIRLWQSKERLARHPNVGGYAMQTLKNVCLDKRRERTYSISIDDVQLELSHDSPYQSLENDDNVSIVKWIIESLPELQRQIINMRDVQEYELSEIVEITGSNMGAVKVNLSRARKKVRDTFLNIQSLKIE